MDLPDHQDDRGDARLLRPQRWRHPSEGGATPESPQAARALWNAASGQFNGVLLRAAIVARGWTVREFARASQTSTGCLYKALGGRAVSDRTVLRIIGLLETRPPSRLLDDGAGHERQDG